MTTRIDFPSDRHFQEFRAFIATFYKPFGSPPIAKVERRKVMNTGAVVALFTTEGLDAKDHDLLAFKAFKEFSGVLK